MFKNYLTVAFRNMHKHKGYTFINITGLAIGMACCLLISLWVLDELSYDRFHSGVDGIHRVLAEGSSGATPNLLGPALEAQVPEILHATRVEGYGSALFSSDGCEAYESGIIAVDTSFFEVFSFPATRGDLATALLNLNSVVISEKIAEKYFPGMDPIGRVLSLNRRHDLMVTAVIENVPHNSSIQFDMLVPIELVTIKFRDQGMDLDYMSWQWWSARTYVRTANSCSSELLSAKIGDFLIKLQDDDSKLTAIPLTQQRFHFSNIQTYIYSFLVIAFFILSMACINFVNLSTARSANRAKETGIRKAAGAVRGNLIAQFLGESLIQSLLGFLVALGLLELILPIFNNVAGMNLSLDGITNSYVLPLVIGLSILTGLAAGAYPALLLSSFHPVSVLADKSRTGSRGSRLRKALVVVQFVLSGILIIGTVTVYSQLGYILNKDIGYDKEHIVKVGMRGESANLYTSLKAQLEQDARVLSVTRSAASLPYWRWTTSAADWDGRDPNEENQVAANMVDFDFVETLGIEMVEGRSFSREFLADTATGYVINEEMAKLMGIHSTALGARLEMWGNPGEVIGVMRNFHFRPLDTLIQPLVLVYTKVPAAAMAIRIPAGDVSSSLEHIEETWKRMVPDYPFTYSFLDEDFDSRYRSVVNFGNLAGGFSALGILLACLGLFGLASFTAEQRTREIGIRKVLGASVAGVVKLLSKEFLILVMVSNVIAWPVAWYVMKRWLENFAYHVDIGIGVFLLAGITTLVIALLTVSYQAIRAARANPVDSLRCE
ncbi:MAG: ABC transporter permease [Candidatus Zixiibacteriota bacterium]|nr:MAG: ABC transporter permease [candidate division Zixibacteria bacterium]